MFRIALCLFLTLACVPVRADTLTAGSPPAAEGKKAVKKEATPSYDDVMNMKSRGKLTPEELAEGDVRLHAVREEAATFGLQAGFAWRYRAILKECRMREGELDMQYPFEQLLLQNGTVQPPVIVRADSYMSVEDKVKMTRTDTAWRIIRPAEFVTNPPTWRNYLNLTDDALSVSEPVDAIRPKTSDEQKVWREAAKEGWELGMEQAELYFKDEMARMNRDFKGMIQYHILEREGKVSIPGISRGHYAVRIGEDTMEINQETFVITDKSHFQEKRKWRSGAKPGE